MNKVLKYTFLFLFVLVTFYNVTAQISQVDSLINLIKNDKIDTNKVNHLNALAIELWDNLDTAIVCSSTALETAKKVNIYNETGWQKGIGKSLYLLGVFSFDKGNFSDALNYNIQALAVWENLEKITTGNELNQIKFSKAKSLGEIGNAYFGQSNYPKALEFQFKALKLNEELGREKGVGNILGNIGNIYSDQKNYEKALEYYLKSLKVGRKLGNKYDMSIDLRNIAIVYNNMGNAAKSLEYSMMALAVSKELGNDLETANNLISVGSALQNQADVAFRSGEPYVNLKELYDKAMDYFSQSIKLQKEQGNDFGLAMNYANMAGIYLVQKNYEKSEMYFKQALTIDSALGSLSQIKHMHEGLSELYYQKGDFKKALLHFQLFSSTKDSIFSEEKDKEITRHEMNYEFEKKEAAQKAEQDKKEALAEADKKRQAILFWLISIVAIAIGVITIVVFRSLSLTKKQKNIIEEQKAIVEEKQREVLDSIRYAKRIQQSQLPTESYILKILNAQQ